MHALIREGQEWTTQSVGREENGAEASKAGRLFFILPAKECVSIPLKTYNHWICSFLVYNLKELSFLCGVDLTQIYVLKNYVLICQILTPGSL